MLRWIFLIMNSMCLLGAAAAAQARVCGVSVTPFVQVIEGQLDAGTTTFTAYRLTRDGQLSIARWTDNNDLLGVAKTVELGGPAYDRARTALSRIDLSEAMREAQPSLGGPDPYSLQIAIQGEEALTRHLRQTAPSDVASGLIAEWQGAGRLKRPARGSYVWTLPIPAEPGGEDVRLAAQACPEGLASWVGAAFVGAVAHKLPPGAPDAQDIQPGRAVFSAQLPDGYAHFGIVSRQ